MRNLLLVAGLIAFLTILGTTNNLTTDDQIAMKANDKGELVS